MENFIMTLSVALSRASATDDGCRDDRWIDRDMHTDSEGEEEREGGV